jgi:DNA-directed RNA polymerase specialized sigma24 family protein
MATSARAAAPTAAAVLTKATLRASALLGLTSADLAAVLGVSAASVSRLGRSREVPATGAEAQLAVLFVRMYRSLDALLGGPEQARAWLHAGNTHLGRPPVELIRTVQGLVHVTEYLDAMRGKS